MSISKKDFNALAAALYHAKPSGIVSTPDKLEQWEYDVRQVASALTDLSSTFNFQQFMADCGSDKYVQG